MSHRCDFSKVLGARSGIGRVVGLKLGQQIAVDGKALRGWIETAVRFLLVRAWAVKRGKPCGMGRSTRS